MTDSKTKEEFKMITHKNGLCTKCWHFYPLTFTPKSICKACMGKELKAEYGHKKVMERLMKYATT